MTSMCEKCRHDKKGCRPRERDWFNLRQRCDYCIKVNSPCSQPQRAMGKDRNKQGMLRRPTTTAETACDQNLPQCPTSIPSAFPTFSVSPKGSASQENSSPSLPCQSTPSQSTTPSDRDGRFSDITRATHSPLTSRKTFEEEGRLSLRRLEDLLAFRRELQQDQMSNCIREQQIGESYALKAAYNHIAKLIRAVDVQIRDGLRALVPITREDMGPSKEPFLRRLKAFTCKLEGNHASPSNTISIEDHEIWADVKQMFVNINMACYQYLQRKGHFSDADFMMDGMLMFSDSSAIPDFGSEHQTRAMFSRVASAFSDILASLDVENDADKDSLADSSLGSKSTHAYPATLLAYRKGRRDLAARWWRQYPALLAEVDPLQRNAAHYAAGHGDLSSLRQFSTHCPDVLRSQATDILGHSPLAVAAIEGHVKAFDFLIRNGADPLVCDRDGRSIMCLAARAERREIIDYMLSTPIFFPMIEQAINQAIQGGHGQLASHMIRRLAEELKYCDSHALESICHQAMLRGMDSVVNEIQNVLPMSVMDQNQALAISTLGGHRYHPCLGVSHQHIATSYNEQSTIQNVMYPMAFDYPNISNAESADLEGVPENGTFGITSATLFYGHRYR